MKIWRLMILLAFCVLSLPLQAAQTAGSYIAFVSTIDGNEDIFVTSLDGSQLYNLTNRRSRNWHPTWSPDGTRIAYNSDQDSNAEIYVMNANGTGNRNLTQNAAGDTSPDWSPAADEIVFLSDRDGGYDLYIVNVADGATRRLTTDGAIKSEPDWSPDGSHITFWQQLNETTVTLMTIDVATGAITTLRDSGQALWPAWSPDGSRIAYFSAENSGVADIFTIEIASGAISNLTNSTANDARPDWSPDGGQIVYMDDSSGNFDLYIMNADGSSPRRLTTSTENDTSPAWQPVAAAIVYDPSAVGLNVNVVQGDVDPESQGELGSGTSRLFAPEVAHVEDVIRVRYEVETTLSAENATPQPTPDIPLRSESAMTVYKFMGAELIGLDMGRFDVFPDPTSYVLQIREDGVNYWEWLLRPKGDEALGVNYLAVRPYLPSRQTDGAVIRENLDPISFTVTVMAQEPEVESEYVQESVEPEDKIGINIYFETSAMFAITFTNAVNITDMTLANAETEFPLLADFPIFSQMEAEVPLNTCVYYEQSGRGDEALTLPRACRTGNAFSLPLLDSEIFWFDRHQRQLANVIVRIGGRAYPCAGGADLCEL